MEEINGKEIRIHQDVYQDEMGFIWMVNDDEMMRYDGYELKSFDLLEKDSIGLQNIRFTKIQEASQGRFFLTTNADKLLLFDPKTEKVQRYQPEQSDSTQYFINHMGEVVQDEDGSIWFTRSALFHWNLKDNRLSKYLPSALLGLSGEEARVADDIRKVRQDPNHKQYIWLTNLKGLMRFNKKNHRLRVFENDQGTYSNSFITRDIHFGNDGKIYVATRYDGLHVLDTLSKKWKVFFNSGKREEDRLLNGVNRIWPKSDTELWVLVPISGLYTFNTSNQQFSLITSFHSNSGLPKESPYHLKAIADGILKDHQGSIWLSMLPKGLASIHPQKQQFKRIETRSFVRKVIPSKNGDKLYLPAGIKGRFHIYDVKKGQLQTFSVEEKEFRSDLRYGTFSPDGKLLLLGWNSLYEFKANEKVIPKGLLPFDSLQLVPNMFDDSHGLRLLTDRHQNLWITLKRKGLLKVHLPSGRYHQYQFSHASSGKVHEFLFPRDLIETDNDQIWVGFGEGLSFTENQGKTWTKYPFTTKTDKGQELTAVSSLQIDKQGRLWIGSHRTGLFYLHYQEAHPQVINSITVRDGLPSTHIQDLELDANGDLWMISDKGLSKMSTKDLTFEHFGPEYGLEGLQTLTLLPNGQMAIATKGEGEINQTGGFYLFHPDSIYIDSTIYQPLIHGLEVMGQNYPLDSALHYLTEIKLKYDQNFFTFHFSAPNFWAPQLIKYQYQLEGVDQDWVDGTDRRFANYTNITHGKYTFKVRASNTLGQWNSSSTSISLVITPPWWQSWWAYTIYILLFFALVAGLFIYQHRRLQLRARLQLELERAERLQELDQFKSRFYTNITHEFRTPLTVIKGMAGQILGQEKIRKLILHNSDRLLEMVNQLLSLSKLENNNLSIKWVNGDIISYLKYLTEAYHSFAESKNIDLAFFSSEDQLIMDFDEEKLQQILINLLSNAVKFTPEYGSVNVMVSKTNHNNASYMQLEVRDTGYGISEDKIPFIFDRFYQADDSKTRAFEGTGIGLALVKELVHLLDGDIHLNSQVDKGTVFTLFLPMHQDAKNKVTTSHSIKNGFKDNSFITKQDYEDSIANNPENPLVLIIEDNIDVTEYIHSCLKKDYQLQMARNGTIGLNKAIENIPDVILCDVMMPEMDGFEVCKQLKSDQRTSHIPIIMLTAKATQEDKNKGLSHGADAYLTKPFNKEELLIRIRNLCQQSQSLKDRLAQHLLTNEELSPAENREALFLTKVHQAIHKYLDNEQFDTNFLCKEMAMSRTQLHRKLKVLTGQSTASFIRSARLKRAKSLLQNTDIPIGEIAFQVGFKDFSHFTRSFSKEFSLKPSEVRK